jgi:hypothetical protein
MCSFFASFNAERAAGKLCRTRGGARADGFDDIKRVYNPRRLHSASGKRYHSAIDPSACRHTGARQR